MVKVTYTAKHTQALITSVKVQLGTLINCKVNEIKYLTHLQNLYLASHLER